MIDGRKQRIKITESTTTLPTIQEEKFYHSPYNTGENLIIGWGFKSL